MRRPAAYTGGLVPTSGADLAKSAPVWASVSLIVLLQPCLMGALSASPSFKPLRYQEDYSYLKDPSKRTGESLGLEPLKYMALGSSGDGYASMGGEVREQYELYRHPDFGLSPEDADGYLLQRIMLHGDLHFSSSVRVFGQVKSAVASFQESPTGPADEDRLDMHQAFVDLTRHGKPAVDNPMETSSFTLRIGRQEMLYGSQRIVSVREGPTVRRSFDAVRLLSKFGDWQVDGFISRPVETDFGVFDDSGDGDAKFWGMYGARSLGGSGAKVEIYYLGLDQPGASFDQGSGDERRHSVGIRLFGECGALDYNFEALGQWGRFNRGRIRAWTIASDTGYTIERFRFGLRADISSGDSNPRDADLGTFNPLFPRGNYFGESAVLGPLNLVDLHPMGAFQMTPSLRLEAGCTWFWRQSLGDGVYGGGLNLIQGAGGSIARTIGHELSFLVAWEVNRHVSISTSYAHFSASSFLRDTGPGHDLAYFTLLATYKF